MKTWKKVLIGIGVLVVVVGSVSCYAFIQQKKDVDSIEYSNIEMNNIEDGVYDGETDTMLIKVNVQVRIDNHKITDIFIIKHDNGMGSQAEKIVESMKENNTYDVDTISGATLSSKVIKSAINRALEKGM